MDVNGSARPVFMVLPTLSDAGKAACVLPLARLLLSVALFSLGLRALGFRGTGRYWPHCLTQAEPHMSSPGVGIGGFWLGFLVVLVGIARGIGGYCWVLWGYWWVLVPSFDVFASFSLGFL